MLQTYQNYLNKHALYPPLIDKAAEKGLLTVVSIPAFNEPDILHKLRSLQQCSPTRFPVEILVLVNHSELAKPEIKAQNTATLHEIKRWAAENNTPRLKFFAVLAADLPKKHAGAGLARKIAMDEALRRFIGAGESDGIIASLDADTLVSENYLAAIENEYRNDSKLKATSFYFEHPVSQPASPDQKPEAMMLYELYLRYYRYALEATGFPDAFYTIGSCFSIRASVYAKQGGMNKRQAGEDFYFLNKIYPLGNCRHLNHIAVYPSSRPSDRVPFGTGPSIIKILEQGEWPTYRPEYFSYLKEFFSKISRCYQAKPELWQEVYQVLHPSLTAFIAEATFVDKMQELNRNTASAASFVQRFFRWFDAFQIIKYLNFNHSPENKIPVTDAAYQFLCQQHSSTVFTKNTYELLMYFRSLEKRNL
ncbi:MAG: glycosyltransferase family 2 protein [Salinivirgaceae bacterium]